MIPVLTIILVYVKPSRVLPLIMTWGDFLQGAAQCNPNCCLEIMEKKFNLGFILRRQTSSAPMKDENGDEDQSCREKLFLPQGLMK